MVRLIREIAHGQEGLTLIEYALIAALVSMIMVGMLMSLGVTLKNFYLFTINSALSTA